MIQIDYNGLIILTKDKTASSSFFRLYLPCNKPTSLHARSRSDPLHVAKLGETLAGGIVTAECI